MTQPQLMRGFERLRRIVTGYLQAAMPVYIDVARGEWALDEYLLPYPVRYDVLDPSLTNDYPAIGMYVTNDRDHVRVDVLDTGAQEYKATFAARIVVMARTPLGPDGSTWLEPEKEQAMRLCNDLTRIMQNALLQGPGCGRPNEVAMDEGSMTTDYYEPVMPNTQSKRWVSMSSTSLNFQLTERTHALTLGTANVITSTLDKLIP